MTPVLPRAASRKLFVRAEGYFEAHKRGGKPAAREYLERFSKKAAIVEVVRAVAAVRGYPDWILPEALWTK